MVTVHTSSSEIPESNNDHHMSGITCELNYTVVKLLRVVNLATMCPVKTLHA